jgi:hypothetical protein
MLGNTTLGVDVNTEGLNGPESRTKIGDAEENEMTDQYINIIEVGLG